jgi:hypothetical protein
VKVDGLGQAAVFQVDFVRLLPVSRYTEQNKGEIPSQSVPWQSENVYPKLLYVHTNASSSPH